MCEKKKKDSKSEEFSSADNTSKTYEKDNLVEEVNESISNEIAYQRFQIMITQGVFDNLEQEDKIKLLKEKSIYKNLVQKISSKKKSESTKLVTSIITKTITISGFYFAIIAFILNSEFIITLNPSILYLVFGSIILLFVGNSIVLPLIFISAPMKSNSAEVLANVNLIQSITFLIAFLLNVLTNTFNVENREMWYIVGIPIFFFIIFLILIWQIRVRDDKGLNIIMQKDE